MLVSPIFYVVKPLGSYCRVKCRVVGAYFSKRHNFLKDIIDLDSKE